MVHLMAHFEYVWYAVQCEQPKPSWHVDLGISTLAEHNLIRLGLAKCKGLDSEKGFQAFLAFPWSTLDAETVSAIPWKPYNGSIATSNTFRLRLCQAGRRLIFLIQLAESYLHCIYSLMLRFLLRKDSKFLAPSISRSMRLLMFSQSSIFLVRKCLGLFTSQFHNWRIANYNKLRNADMVRFEMALRFIYSDPLQCNLMLLSHHVRAPEV